MLGTEAVKVERASNFSVSGRMGPLPWRALGLRDLKPAALDLLQSKEFACLATLQHFLFQIRDHDRRRQRLMHRALVRDLLEARELAV